MNYPTAAKEVNFDYTHFIIIAIPQTYYPVDKSAATLRKLHGKEKVQI